MEFEFLLAKIERMYPEEERKRLSKRPRQRGIGAGRRFSLNLQDRVLLLLFYYRTYATQDVAAEVFGVGQTASLTTSPLSTGSEISIKRSSLQFHVRRSRSALRIT